MKDKSRVKNFIQFSKDQMVNQPISYSSFAYNSVFWVIDVKGCIPPVSVCLIDELMMQVEHIVFQISFKVHYITFRNLTALKLIPRNQYVFQTN